jgi:hypothetical protein
MRRAFLAAALGGVLLASAACSSDAETPAAAPAAATPLAAATTPAPDYSANTKLVCGKVEKIFNDDLEGFGTQIGKMIAYKEAKQTVEAEKSEKAAGKELREIGAKVKKATAAAQDPELKTAGAASAAKFTKSATDAKFFDSIKTTKDLDRTIEAKMTDWVTPVAGYCA